MRSSLEFFLGLLEEQYPACVAWEDFSGTHGPALALLQQMGFVSIEPGLHPMPSCSHCEGVPYRLGERYLCNRCLSTIDRRHLCVWQIDQYGFLSWLAWQLRLQGGVRQIDDQLWQLGSGESGEERFECFFVRGGALLEAAKSRLSAYRSTVVLYSVPWLRDRSSPSRWVCLLEILDLGRALTLANREALLRDASRVRFDLHSGTLWAGHTVLGEVPMGSKEHAFLRCLADHLDTFVSYPDIKHFVLQYSGSTDTTEEATYCQLLKSRIKKKWVPGIDRLIVTSNKADGYRLRGVVEAY